MTSGLRKLTTAVVALLVITSVATLSGFIGSGAAQSIDEASPSATAATADISSCTTISTEGVHKLTQDITLVSNCIEITADNVTLNGTHNFISGGSGFGIYVNATPSNPAVTNVTITNIGLFDFDDGIRISNDSQAEIVETRIENNSVGVRIGATDSRVNISQNLILNNSQTGVHINSSSNASRHDIHFNRLAGNGNYGVNNANGTSIVNATLNDWEFARGVQKPGSATTTNLTDPVTTSIIANGTGDNISEGATAGVSNVQFHPLDPHAPTITNAQATDLTDGDGTVSESDEVEVLADISDVGIGVDTVIANASAFGAGNVTLHDDDNDGTFTATFTVDESHAASEGSYSITIVANDSAGNVNTNQTNALTLDRTLTTASGRILEPDSSPAAHDLVITTDRTDVFNQVNTDSGGNYSVEVAKNRIATVTVIQGEVFFGVDPRDGIVDLYEFNEVNLSEPTDLGNETLPSGHVLNVTVVNESAVPVENASILVTHNSKPDVKAASLNVDTDATGMLNISNSKTPGVEVVGNVTVAVFPPADDPGFVHKSYGRKLNVTSNTSITITLEELTTATGRLFENDSDPSVNDTIAIIKELEGGFLPPARTNDTGHFKANISKNLELDLQYYQAHPKSFEGIAGEAPESETSYVRDGSVDMYALARINTSTPVNLGNVTLPKGYVVNVTVVNESGVPVENASVSFEHHSPTGPADAGVTSPNGTNANGMFEVDDSDVPPGFELTGNVTVEIDPPTNANGFINQTYTRNLTVTSDTSITITLQEVDEMSPGIENARAIDAGDSDENVSHGDTVTVSADVTDDNSGVDTVMANASAFGAGNVTLTDEDNDGTYNTTFTVNASKATGDGSHTITIVANDSAGNVNRTSTNPLTLDTTPPTITNAQATDATDGDGEVGDGDSIAVSAVVTDAGAGVDTVMANASAFGAGNVTLTDEDNDGTYNTTFTVNASQAAADGSYAITIGANDIVNNTNVTSTNKLDLNTTAETTPEDTVAPSQPGFEMGVAILALLLGVVIAIRRRE